MNALLEAAMDGYAAEGHPELLRTVLANDELRSGTVAGQPVPEQPFDAIRVIAVPERCRTPNGTNE